MKVNEHSGGLSSDWRARIAGVATLLLAALITMPGSNAQSTGGRIRGTVADPSGAAVAAAQVELINQENGRTRDVQTEEDGTYLFLEIPIGTYEIDVTQKGFKKYVRKGVILHLNEVLSVDVTLQLGSAEQSIEVTGAPPVVDTTSTQLGAVVNSRDATQLPLNERDVYQLLQLQPGVQSQLGNDMFYGSGKAGVVTVNGGRGRSNNYSVNGGDGNDLFANLPAVQPSADSIEEFRVITNNFDAEYGRNSGAVVNVVTKSGTNDWHGSGFEFLRNKVLNSKGYFDTAKPDFIQNQFGGTFGGPIKKDKTFFFGSYEGRRIKKGISTSPVLLPTAAQQTGDFSGGDPTAEFDGTLNSDQVAEVLNNRSTCAADVSAAGGGPIAAGAAYADIFPNAKIPTSCLDPLSTSLLNEYVHPTSDGLYQAAPNSTERGDQLTVKLDHDLSDKQKLTGYYYFDDDTSQDPFATFQGAGANLGNFPGVYATRTQQVNITHTWTVSPTAVNEARFSYFREGQGKFDKPVLTSLVQDSCGSAAAAYCFTGATDTGILPADPNLGIHPGLGAANEGLPFISVDGGFSLGNNSEGQLPQVGNTFQWSDNFSKIVGNHSFKFGADVRYQKFDQTLYYNVNGLYGFGSGGTNDLGGVDTTDSGGNVVNDGNVYPDFMLGLPSSYSQGSANDELVRSKSVYLFVQDSWQIKSNLTFNYGLRWEVNTPLNDIGHKVQTFRPGQVSSIYPCQLSADNAQYFTDNYGITDPNCDNTGVTPTGLVFPGDKGVPLSLSQTYWKGFAPRLGLNWSPGWTDGALAKLTGGPSKTSISMGWGLFYNPIEQLVLEQFSAEPPFGGSNYIVDPTFQAPYLDQQGTVYPNPFDGILSPPRGSTIDWSTFRSILLFGQFPKILRPQYSAQYNLTIKRELPGNLLFQVGYVGTQGHRLLASYDINHGNPQTCLDLQAIADFNSNDDLSCSNYSADNPYFLPPGTQIPTSTPSGGLVLPYNAGAGGLFVPGGTTVGPDGITLVGLRQYSSPNCQPMTGTGCPVDGIPVFSNIFSEDTIAKSNYNSLQVLLEKRFSHGLQFQAAYTYSKSLDNASSFESSLNPIDFNATYGSSLYDARHRLVYSYVWQLPVPKYEGFKGKVLNGWETSGIITFQSGFPVRITSGDDNEELSSYFFEAPGEPNITGPFKTWDIRKHDGYVFDPTLFDNCSDADCPGDPTAVPLGTIGNAPRSICCGPGINNFDMGFYKDTAIGEKLHMQFRAEIYNVFNHAQFYSVQGDASSGPDFGRALKVRDPRLFQFALKFNF